VADRYRGFLSSIIPEVGPGVYVSSELSCGVRERLWTVLSGWRDGTPGGSVMLVWKDDAAPSRLGLLTLGLPARTLVDLDGVLLVRRG
jgi:CRISPR-associated protein Cas2